MKRCPTCNQTFEEDWLSFCTQDGTTLIDDRGTSSEPRPTVAASPTAKATTPNEQLWNLPSGGFGASGGQLPEPGTPEPTWKPPPPPSYKQPNKSLASASMVIGIISVTVGWMCLGPLPAIGAIIMGAIALLQIKKNPERIGGRQFAVTGIITGSLTVLIYAGILIFYVVMIVIASAN